jgi:hypothetical protein
MLEDKRKIPDEVVLRTGSIADIPQEVLDGIVRDQLGIFSVGLLGVRTKTGELSLKLCGSGTLVSIAGRHYILTSGSCVV